VKIDESRGVQPDPDACGLDAATRNAQRTVFNNYVTRLWNPSSWCASGSGGSGYQCHGDTDGVQTGFPDNYRIYTGDLNKITTTGQWKKKLGIYPDGADPDCDVDHKSSGFPDNYQIYSGDLNRIIISNWKAKNTQFTGGANCPLTDAANNTYVDPTP
jgi:hypothetical protein